MLICGTSVGAFKNNIIGQYDFQTSITGVFFSQKNNPNS